MEVLFISLQGLYRGTLHISVSPYSRLLFISLQPLSRGTLHITSSHIQGYSSYLFKPHPRVLSIPLQALSRVTIHIYSSRIQRYFSYLFNPHRRVLFISFRALSSGTLHISSGVIWGWSPDIFPRTASGLSWYILKLYVVVVLIPLQELYKSGVCNRSETTSKPIDLYLFWILLWDKWNWK